MSFKEYRIVAKHNKTGYISRMNLPYSEREAKRIFRTRVELQNHAFDMWLEERTISDWHKSKIKQRKEAGR